MPTWRSCFLNDASLKSWNFAICHPPFGDWRSWQAVRAKPLSLAFARQLSYKGEPLAKRLRLAEFNGTTSKLHRNTKASPDRGGGTPLGVTERFRTQPLPVSGLALSVIASQCHLSQRERQGLSRYVLGSPFGKDSLRPEGDVAKRQREDKLVSVSETERARTAKADPQALRYDAANKKVRIAVLVALWQRACPLRRLRASSPKGRAIGISVKSELNAQSFAPQKMPGTGVVGRRCGLNLSVSRSLDSSPTKGSLWCFRKVLMLFRQILQNKTSLSMPPLFQVRWHRAKRRRRRGLPLRRGENILHTCSF